MAEGVMEQAAVAPPVIGYSTCGRLIRGRRRGHCGAWLVPFPADEFVLVHMANALDRMVLGAAADEPVVVLLKTGGEARRYRARDTSFMAVPAETAEDGELFEKLTRESAAREGGENERE